MESNPIPPHGRVNIHRVPPVAQVLEMIYVQVEEESDSLTLARSDISLAEIAKVL